MKKRFTMILLALILCLGLTVPAAASGAASSAPKVDIALSVPGNPEPTVGNYQVRSVQTGALTDKSSNTTIGYVIARVSEPKEFSLSVNELPLGTTITVSDLRNDWGNKSGEVDIVGIQAYSDPDGDGVYDQWIYNFENEPPVVPLTEESVAYLPTEMGKYSNQALITKDNEMGLDTTVLPGSVTFTTDYLSEVFGPNTLVLVQLQVWTVISTDPVTAFPTGNKGTMAYLITGEKTESAPDAPGTPDAPSAPSFTDVAPDAYYAAPVAWAVQKEITAGTGDNKFSPAQNCTNAQILTFIWRAYGKPEPTVENPFTNAIPDGYAKAAIWASEKGMVSGTTFDVDKPCTRAMAMTYLWQAAGSPETEPTGKFTDVAASDPYAQAVAWAVANGITKGATDTTFAPESICQRGQIAVFLYNAVAKN